MVEVSPLYILVNLTKDDIIFSQSHVELDA